MKNISEKKNETGIKALAKKIGKYLYKHSDAIVCCMVIAVLVCLGTVHAADTTAAPAVGDGSADSMWKELTSLISTWVTRLGGAIIFVGGVMFGLGWKSDDAEQKSRGISTIIAGAIVAAVAGLAGTFFK